MKGLAVQMGLAVAYYVSLVVVSRLLGKRMAGQVTSFDLVIFISMCVVLQQVMLREGALNAVAFVITTLAAHIALGRACAKYRWLRRAVRGAPRPLVEHGQVVFGALEDEGLSYDELLAGLRKLGYDDPHTVELATLEETGHISAVGKKPADLPS